MSCSSSLPKTEKTAAVMRLTAAVASTIYDANKQLPNSWGGASESAVIVQRSARCVGSPTVSRGRCSGNRQTARRDEAYLFIGGGICTSYRA